MPRIETHVTVNVSVPKRIDKRDLKFHYSFISKGNNLKLIGFDITGLEPVKKWDLEGRVTRSYVFLAPGLTWNRFTERGYGSKPLFVIKSLKKYKTLKDVKVPNDVRDRAYDKLTRLVRSGLRLRNG